MAEPINIDAGSGTTTDPITGLQHWYAAQCDGEWEMCFGIKIVNIDNPGWHVEIELEGTSLEHVPFEFVFHDRSPHDWVRCSVDEKIFHAYCGARNLSEAIDIFLVWARASEPDED